MIYIIQTEQLIALLGRKDNMQFFSDIRRWFRNYPGPSIAITVVLILLIVGLLSLIFSNGGLFLLILIVGAIGIGMYYNQNNSLPPLWIVISIICIPLFMWGFWVINEEWYNEWRNSRAFLWMIITMVVLVALGSQRNVPMASLARVGLGALMLIAIIMGAVGKASDVVAKKKATSKATLTTAVLSPIIVEPRGGTAIYREVIARPGQPVVGVMPGNWDMCYWHNEAEVDKEQVDFQGIKKRRFFFLRDGVAQSQVRLWIYPKHLKSPCDAL